MNVYLNRKALRLHLLENDMTQDDLAKQTGLNVGRLSGMATGRFSVPSTWIAKLLGATELSFDDLFTIRGEA